MTRGDDFEDISRYSAEREVVDRVIRESEEGFLAWVASDGSPRVSTITHIVVDGVIYYTSIPDRGKAIAMHRDPRISMAFSGRGTSLDRPINVTLVGTARLVDNEPLRSKVMATVSEKLYRGESSSALQTFKRQFMDDRRLVVRVEEESIHSFDWARMAQHVHES